MKVIALKFENYRNLKDNIITPCDGVNIIYGDNAQGKTNLLEALWFFCGGHSFRGSKDSEIINWNENFARIEMRFLGQEREQTAKILFRGGKKSVEINGVQKNSAAALIERFCAVVKEVRVSGENLLTAQSVVKSLKMRLFSQNTTGFSIKEIRF